MTVLIPDGVILWKPMEVGVDVKTDVKPHLSTKLVSY